ncbi:MAG: RidA family protein, partial [Rhodospirillaceae bacterium]|nr:RidA family protein [Rhodospirillaceae bacterium]
TYLTEIPYQEDYKQVRDRIMGEHKPPNPILIIKDLVRVPLKVEIEILAAKL